MTAQSTSMKPDNNSSPSPATSTTRPGMDAIVQDLVKAGLPVTRENYLHKAGWTEPLEPELEATLPAELQRWGE